MTTIKDLAKMIDHSLLHPTMTDADLSEGCQIALQYDVASVCIKPYAVSQATTLLKGSDVLVGTVIGFPHGNSATKIKVAETVQACMEGAAEIDMVINIGKALSGDWQFVKRDIEAVCKAAHEHGAILKVIFENDFIPEDATKIKLCEICSDLGVDFVKTSSGYGMVKGEDGKYSYQGATLHDLELMRAHSDERVQVKAAGGVRTLDDLLAVRALGVSRVGATATIAMLEEAKDRFGSGSDRTVPDEDKGGY